MRCFVAFVTLCSRIVGTWPDQLGDPVNDRGLMESALRTEVNEENEAEIHSGSSNRFTGTAGTARSCFAAFDTLCSRFVGSGPDKPGNAVNDRDLLQSGLRTEVNEENEEEIHSGSSDRSTGTAGTAMGCFVAFVTLCSRFVGSGPDKPGDAVNDRDLLESDLRSGDNEENEEDSNSVSSGGESIPRRAIVWRSNSPSNSFPSTRQ
jgi:hypothetical protein